MNIGNNNAEVVFPPSFVLNESMSGREKKAEKLDSILKQMADDTNKYIREELNFDKEFILDDCRINMDAFDFPTEMGDKYDKELAQKLKNESLDFSNESVFAHYSERYKTKDVHEMESKYLEEKEGSNATKVEKAITILLHKFIGDEYIVARGSLFDDHCRGTDNVLINKATGEVICAFDGVSDPGNSSRLEKKIKIVKEKARKGGAEIIYGAGIKIKEESGQEVKTLSPRQLKNLPLFYLCISADEMKKLYKEMDEELSSKSSFEEEIFKKLLSSLESQVEMLNNERIHEQIAKKIPGLRVEIARLQKKINISH